MAEPAAPKEEKDDQKDESQTREESSEEYKIAEGTVTNEVGDNHAWILVDDETAEKIKLGDYVKQNFESSFKLKDLQGLLKF